MCSKIIPYKTVFKIHQKGHLPIVNHCKYDYIIIHYNHYLPITNYKSFTHYNHYLSTSIHHYINHMESTILTNPKETGVSVKLGIPRLPSSHVHGIFRDINI